MTDIETWRISRQQSVAEDQGDLALVGLHTIDKPLQLEGIPGLWAPLPSGEPGLLLTASAEDGIIMNEVLIEGTVNIEAEVSIIRFSETVTAGATSQPGSPHLLAVWDTDAAAMKSYEGISSFPYDERWVIEAEYLPSGDERTVAFAHNSDQAGNLRIHQSPGDIRFVNEDVTYVLSPFDSEGSLIVVFGDKTNGQETYGMGRMLLVSPNADGTVKLDFNRAFLPPCAFSYHFNCPLPPAHNRLPFAVTAGEQQVINHE
ncbi:MAG: DUF1684 domain-containing protein [Candidatus Pristimantibacillus sp.]